MRRRWLFLPLVALVLGTGWIGLRTGGQVARLDEGAVIQAVAERYAADTGGALTDCVARPGAAGESWLRVDCNRPGAEGVTYLVGRFGRIERLAPGAATGPERPET